MLRQHQWPHRLQSLPQQLTRTSNTCPRHPTLPLPAGSTLIWEPRGVSLGEILHQANELWPWQLWGSEGDAACAHRSRWGMLGSATLLMCTSVFRTRWERSFTLSRGCDVCDVSYTVRPRNTIEPKGSGLIGAAASTTARENLEHFYRLNFFFFFWA